jgi:hypothetical protein
MIGPDRLIAKEEHSVYDIMDKKTTKALIRIDNPPGWVTNPGPGLSCIHYNTTLIGFIVQ